MDYEGNANQAFVSKIFFLVTIAKYVFFPLLFIWSVNTLFHCGIPMTLKNWLAAFVLFFILRSLMDVNAPPFQDDYDDRDAGYDYDDDFFDEDGFDDFLNETGDDMQENDPPQKARIIVYNGKRKREESPPENRK